MKNSRRAFRVLSGASLAGLAACLTAGTAQAQVLPTNPPPDSTCVVPPTEFAGWFVSGSPGLNGPVKPADSILLNTSNNCNFYKWSEQMFLWLTSPASGQYQGGRVLDSQVFYQVNGSSLVAQNSFGPRNFAVRAAQFGPDGLPVVIDAAGHLREFVTAPTEGGVTTLALTGKKPAAIASVEAGSNGKALFRDAQGKSVPVTPKVTADMLPANLGRLVGLVPPAKGGLRALSETSERQQIANTLNASKVLIQFTTPTGSVFVEAGTGIIDNLGPGQAGGNGVLASQQDSVIFYETLVNDVYAWYLTGRKTQGGIAPYYNTSPPTYGFFPTSATDLQAIVDFAKGHGGPSSFPDGEALAVEAKLSWVDASKLPNGGQGYITTQAFVPTYNTSNPRDWVPGPAQVKTVALVGAHFVGSTKGHPEMVWATFEHQANTPLATYQYNSGGNPVTVQQNTAGTWLFSTNGATSNFNFESAVLCPNSNKPTTQCPTTSLDGHVVAATTTAAILPPGNALRMKAWGVGSNGVPNNEDKTPAASNTEVISLDTNVQAQLKAAGASTDLRYNYLMIGSTWTFGGGEPTGPYPNNPANPPTPPKYDVVGTSMLFNSTMETFQQGADTTFQTGFDCFACHTASAKTPVSSRKADTFVSHIFGSTSPLPAQ